MAWTTKLHEIYKGAMEEFEASFQILLPRQSPPFLFTLQYEIVVFLLD